MTAPPSKLWAHICLFSPQRDKKKERDDDGARFTKHHAQRKINENFSHSKHDADNSLGQRFLCVVKMGF